MCMLVHCKNDGIATVIAQGNAQIVWNIMVEKVSAYINPSFTAIDYLLDNFRYQWPWELLELLEFKLLGKHVMALILNSEAE